MKNSYTITSMISFLIFIFTSLFCAFKNRMDLFVYVLLFYMIYMHQDLLSEINKRKDK